MTRPGAPNRRPVLVVDDDELVRWSVAEGLKEFGHAVEVAANARQALRRCPHAAVALLNHDLPAVNGLALADALRRRHPRCAIVLMTTDRSLELRHRARERGVVQVLAKPFSLEDLVDAVRAAKERSLGLPTRSRGSPAGADGETVGGPWHTELHR